MENKKNGRILDKGFENDINKGISNLQKDAQNSIDQAQTYVYQKNDDAEFMIREHPKSFVLGAFMGGILVGTLLSKRGE